MSDAIFSTVSVCLVCVSIFSLRQKHSDHVYMLWYTFCLTLCICTILFLALPGLVTGFTDDTGMNIVEKSSRTFLTVSKDLDGEVHLIAIILAILVLPQILSFIISGLFGCGVRPILVSRISEVATLSLVKFFCVLSGVDAALALSPWTATPTTNATASLMAISFAFAILALHFDLDEVRGKIRSTLSAQSGLKRLLKYMTRYRDGSHTGLAPSLPFDGNSDQTNYERKP
jgi:hypothetical protein